MDWYAIRLLVRQQTESLSLSRDSQSKLECALALVAGGSSQENMHKLRVLLPDLYSGESGQLGVAFTRCLGILGYRLSFHPTAAGVESTVPCTSDFSWNHLGTNAQAEFFVGRLQ
jgi:hypothetical protein